MGTIIFGAGPFAALLKQHLVETGHDVAAFVVDAGHNHEGEFAGRPMLAWGAFLENEEYHDCDILIGVGHQDMRVRAQVGARIPASGRRLATFIHPRAHVSPEAELGPGCILLAGAVVEPFARLGRNNCISSNATICHRTVMGDHNYVSAGVAISHDCMIGSASFFGVGAQIGPGVRVSDSRNIEAGAVLQV